MAIANSTNLVPSPGSIVVDPVAGKGDFTTITAAVAAVSAGQTIYVRPGTYDDDFTVTVNNISIVGLNGSIGQSQTLITGKISSSTDLILNIANLNLETNGDYSVEHSTTGVINIRGCNIFSGGNASLRNTSTGAIRCWYCTFNVANSNGISFEGTSTGSFVFEHCSFPNTSNSVQVNTSSGLLFFKNCECNIVISNSSTSSFQAFNCGFSAGGNATTLTINGTGTVTRISNCWISTSSATLSALEIGSGATARVFNTTIRSLGTNAVTGAGTLIYSNLSFMDTSAMSVSTQTPIADLVRSGGTGVSSQAAYSLVAGGTTTTGAFQAIAPVAVGQVLTSTGTGSLPAFSATPSVTSVAIGSGALSITSGTGAPSASVPKGSLYLRTDGSGVNDRAYIATDAVGTWTPIVTVG